MKLSKIHKDRTFGMELEFADADTSQIVLPAGYSWTENELTGMINSDGSVVTKNGKYGGEINTRPLKNTKEDIDEVFNFITHLRECGAYLIWNTGFDSHLYIKDLGLENIKKIFGLSYYVGTYIKQLFDMPDWFENKYQSPTPDYSYVRKVYNAKSIEDFNQIFANSSDRGHIRFYVNIFPVNRLGTVEFRFFNSSFERAEVEETINFMYNYIDYAINNDADSFKELDSMEKVIKAFKLNPDRLPKRHHPLIWAEEHTVMTTNIGEPFRKNRPMMNKIVEGTKGYEKVHLVNSYFMDIEQVLCKTRNVKLYTKDLFTFIAYKIILEDDFVFELQEPFGFIEIHEGTKAERLSKLYVFEQVKKCMSGSDHHSRKLKDFQDNLKKIVDKMLPNSQKVIDRLSKSNIEVTHGDLEDALNEVYGKDDEIIVYQSEFSISNRSASNGLSAYGGFENLRFPTFYAQLDISTVPYIVVSKNKYLGLEKVLRDGRTFLYSNVDMTKTNRYHARHHTPVMYKKIPDDHKITKNSTIKFMRATMSQIDYLRSIYLKKDILLGGAIFNYLWFIDDYLIGATMFDYSKQAVAAGDKIWMKSDFVIDSKIPKLSRLLIMAVKSKEFKEELDFKYKTSVDIITTTVFSNNKVSMKYRGVFELDKRDGGKLYYDAKAGSYNSNKAILVEYLDKVK